MKFIIVQTILFVGLFLALANCSIDKAKINSFFASGSQIGAGHSNNWAVLVCTSRFWFNYRHIANTLSLYRTVKRLGIPDSNIILMLADDVACNPRNTFPGTVFNNADRKIDLYGGSIENAHDGTIEVDYRGYEVTVENFIRLLTGRHDEDVPKSKRLQSDDKSNILVFMTGHGGDEFLKFQDAEEISSRDIADAFQQMHERKRYNEILFMVDTCQANTLYSQFYSPNILASGSSRKGENSLSHHVSRDIGVAVIDRYTYYLLDFMEEKVESMSSKALLRDLFQHLTFDKLHSNVGVRTDLFHRNFSTTVITDFFGHVPKVEITSSGYPLERLGNFTMPSLFHNNNRYKQAVKNIEKAYHSALQGSKQSSWSFKSHGVILKKVKNVESDNLKYLYGLGLCFLILNAVLVGLFS